MKNMARKIKVLEVLYGLGYGGIRACIQNYISNINKDEFKVDVYAYGVSESPFKDQFERMGCHVHMDPANDIADKHIILFIWKLYRFIKQGGYDVVHAHCNLISAWVTLAAMIAGARIRISHSHSTAHLSGSRMQLIWSLLRRWVISCTATTQLACGRLAGETMYGRRGHFYVLPNGITIDRFMSRDENRIRELREKLNIPEGVKVYTNVTRMDPPKNHIFAVDVFHEIHKIDPTAIFIYGGVIPPVQSTVDVVQARIKALGLEPFTRYTGPIMDIEHLYHLSDLWIYCSLHEGLPYGPIELQAASVPCLASDVITKEIDLGLGMVKFLSLDESPKTWAMAAVETKKPTIGNDKIKHAFMEKNFCIQANVSMLEIVYRGKLK